MSAVARLADLLRERGAAAIDHPGGTRDAHLERVQHRLAELGASPMLQLAARAHAVYGTDGSPSACSLSRSGRCWPPISLAQEEPMTTTARTATFETTVTATGNNTGIVVPGEILEQLGAGKRPAVVVDVNGHEYRSTVGSMGGTPMISVSAAVRQDTGLQGGDPVRVTLTVADTPREVDVPADLAEALAADGAAGAFFAALSNSLQRYHVDTINAAKTAETRQRRIDKALELFRAGKKR